MRLLERAEKILGRLLDYFSVASGIFLLILVIINTLAVCQRYLLNNPLEWSLSVSNMLMVTSVFLCGAYTLKTDSHVSVDLLIVRMSEKKQRVLSFIKYIIILIFMSILTWHSFFLALDNVHSVTDSIDRLPLFPTYLVVPIGSAILCFYVVIRITKGILEFKERGSTSS
jgi:TRAP-type C4-dicarboxylate transport system permease small subunit